MSGTSTPGAAAGTGSSPTSPSPSPSATIGTRVAAPGVQPAGMAITGSPVPTSVQAHPRLGDWLALREPGRIEVRSGKVELGQGIATALALMAADALGVDVDQIDLIAGDTAFTPDEGYTAGSLSIEVGGAALVHVCRWLRALCSAEAARRLGVPAEQLVVRRGCFQVQGSQVPTSQGANSDAAAGPGPDYHALAATLDWADLRVDRLFDAHITSAGAAPRRDGAPVRADLPLKLGGGGFVHDLRLAGMWHARVLRGPHAGCRIRRVDAAALRQLAGVLELVHEADFLALAGPDEATLVAAAEAARAHVDWLLPTVPALPPEDNIEALLTSLPARSSTAVSTAVLAPWTSARSLTRRYTRPYIAHASIGVSCAVAQPATSDGARPLTIWTHSQGTHQLRKEVAQVLGLPPAQVRVIHAAGAGCYGHNGADDVAFDAAWLAQRLNRPVQVAWSRADDMCVAPLGSASLVQLSASLTDDGRLAQWQAQVWSHSHLGRPGWGTGPNLLGAWALDPDGPRPEPGDPPLPNGGGLRNAIPYYEVPALEVQHHFIAKAPVRVSALRSLGAHANVFAIESFMDELAEVAEVDPVEFRLRHLVDERARAVVQAAARMCDWAALRASLPAGEGRGLGFGFGRYKNKSAYCAVAIEVEVGEAVRVTRVWTAVDAGAIVHRDGLMNQVEGGVIQALSWCLKEAVGWDATGITTTGWETYPILGFDELPQLDIELIDRPGQPGLGSGELAAGPVAGALANAVTQALGLRPRHLPVTPDRLLRLVHAEAG